MKLSKCQGKLNSLCRRINFFIGNGKGSRTVEEILINDEQVKYITNKNMGCLHGQRNKNKFLKGCC